MDRRGKEVNAYYTVRHSVNTAISFVMTTFSWPKWQLGHSKDEVFILPRAWTMKTYESPTRIELMTFGPGRYPMFLPYTGRCPMGWFSSFFRFDSLNFSKCQTESDYLRCKVAKTRTVFFLFFSVASNRCSSSTVWTSLSRRMSTHTNASGQSTMTQWRLITTATLRHQSI